MVKAFMMLQKISISNKFCLINFNFTYNNIFFLEQHIQIISEGSFDT